MLNDLNAKKENKIARFDLTKGYHVLLWQYGFYNDFNYNLQKSLKAKIYYIVVDGIEETQYGCKECNKDVNSSKRNDLCRNCDVNYYFDEEIVFLFRKIEKMLNMP